MERGRIQGLPKFLGPPIISGTGKDTDFNLGEKGAWTYPGTAEFFWVPPIISGTGKATYFKFCRHIHRVDRNKSP